MNEVEGNAQRTAPLTTSGGLMACYDGPKMFETVEAYSRKKYDTGKVQPKWLSRAMLVTSIVGVIANISILLSR